MIRGRKPGANITLMNTLFWRNLDPEKNKLNEYLTLVYKDCDTGLKYAEEIINPDYEYYIANPNNRVNYNRLFIEEDKVQTIVQKVYGGANVQFTDSAKKQINNLVKFGWDALPICMAKTQYSLSDQPSLLGRPEGFTVTVREVTPKLGAGFIVCLTGDIMTMPGLPKQPAALKMDVAEDGSAIGLF